MPDCHTIPLSIRVEQQFRSENLRNIVNWMPRSDAFINQLENEAGAIAFTNATVNVEAHQDIQVKLMAMDPRKTTRACQLAAYMGRLLKGV